MSKAKKANSVSDNLSRVNANAAGLDIGASEIYAAVPADRDEEPVRAFGTFTVDLHQLADWLLACGIETVAMESTGIYWIPIYDILEACGMEVCLVNAHHLKNVPGRKSDVNDCQWIQQLHSFGLLRASFRPPADICALRALVRHRETLVQARAAHIQHMQKALQLMNVQLPQVIKDITGVTGMNIIRAIVAGERDPQVLAQFRDGKCAKSEAEFVKALKGSYQPEHLFALTQALEAFDFYGRQLQACDEEIEALYASLPPSDPGVETQPPDPNAQKRRKNQAHFDLASSLYQIVGVDLTAIDGIGELTAQTLISEIGLDMNRWPTVKHFTSWLGLSPQREVSGGKLLRSRTKKTQNRANTALRVAAQTLARSQSALGAFYRSIRARHGAPKAVTATAHKLARILYAMLKHRTPYRDPGVAHFEQAHQERTLRSLQRRAKRLGMQLVPVDSVPVDPSDLAPQPLVS